MRTTWIRSRSARVPLVLLAAAVAALVVVFTAAAQPASNFEIDSPSANLKVDGSAPAIDWMSVSENDKDDAETGANDDSYAGGAKENDPCPNNTTGSIPNNKSDLRSFGVYFEPGQPGYLNLYWTRVQDPSGTTLMDFELNRSDEACGANRINPVRTEGDLLIEYRIEQGGATAQIKVREWTGSVWGPADDLTASGDAFGTINQSAIPANESDIGALSARTFGEARLDLSSIIGTDACTAFSTAFLKSRSSDSFTSQLKDFIGPESIDINNCGAILIQKTRKHAADGPGDHPHAGVDFTIDDGDVATDPITATTESDGTACVEGLEPGSYTVTEDEPAGYADVASQQVTVTGSATCDDVTPMTFSNTPLTDITVSVDSQVDGGTASTIDCDPEPEEEPEDYDATGEDPSATLSDKEPGIYTCTINVDP